ncbi:MAG TPA: pantoate--beta-alanine ligase [Mycobacteriales bacterium]|nr:pantoate--beta-alanine ligase [Mycobacteriales bacterium]
MAATREELALGRAALPGRVAVVMTMGALHRGHAALLERAKDVADSVVATVFVNPLQFGPSEDLARYPRPLEADLALCASKGVDLVFTPSAQVIYPTKPMVRVRAGRMGEVLEGAARPGHLDGVLTVVLKLLHLVAPDIALFGEKDAQQLACVRRMVADLDVPVEILAVPTVREPDGLALSSRNRYLSAAERERALGLPHALSTGDAEQARQKLSAEGIEVDYVEQVDSTTFEPATDGDLLVGAVRIGGTRLIDNVRLPLGT